MNYEDIFGFAEIDGGYELVRAHPKETLYDLRIPGTYMGEPVLRIAERAFERSYFLETVYIPPEVEEIGSRAFYGCSRLCAAEFSEGLKRIGWGAFSDCDSNLISLTFPKGLEYIGDSAFENCWNLEKVTFLDTGTRLGYGVFDRCPKMPAEAQLINILCSSDITAPMPGSVFGEILEVTSKRKVYSYTDTLFREEVFSLAVRNKCFRSAKRGQLIALFELLAENQFWSLIRIAVGGELIPDAELAKKMIAVSSKNGQTELTAMLLEYQRRIFGFDRTDKFDL